MFYKYRSWLICLQSWLEIELLYTHLLFVLSSANSKYAYIIPNSNSYNINIFILVRVWPFGDTVSRVGGQFRLLCVSITATPILQVYWLVNDTLLENSPLNSNNDVVPEFSGGLGTLTLTNLPAEYNSTNFRCLATTSSGNETSLQHSRLLLQG